LRVARIFHECCRPALHRSGLLLAILGLSLGIHPVLAGESPGGDEPCITPRDGYENQVSRLYGAKRGDLEVRVVQGGSSQVFNKRRQVTSGDRIRWHADSLHGKTVWVETKWNNGESQIVLNCRRYAAKNAAGTRLLSFPTLLKSKLVWVETTPYADSSDLVVARIDADRLTELTRFTMPGPTDWLDRRQRSIQSITFLPQSAEWLLVELDVNKLTLQVKMRSEHPLWVDSRSGELRRARGEPSATTPFWAAHWLVAAEHTEPFAIGNDHLGRLGNTAAERLLAMSHLHKLWPDSMVLSQRIQQTAIDLMSTLDHQGRTCSTKYSIDRSTCVAYGHDVMGIHNALLSVLPAVDKETAMTIAAKASQAFNSYAPDHDGTHWRFPRCIAEQFDGVPMPFNQQHRLALVALLLSRLPGEEEKRRYAETALKTLKAEWVEREGVLSWFYWPAVFYQGWTTDSGLSCNTPQRLPELPTVFDDSYHGAIVAEFLLQSGEDFSRVEAIANGLVEGKNLWRLFMQSPASIESPMWRNLPVGVLAASSVARHSYANKIVLPIADFDNQMAFTGQSFTASRTLASERAVASVIIESALRNGRWKRVEALQPDSDLPAWWESNRPSVR